MEVRFRRVWIFGAFLACFAVLQCLLPHPGLASDAPASSEIAQYGKDFGVSAKVAEERLETQQRGASIVAELKVALGRGYAGVWFDNETGEFVVPLLPGADHAAAAAKLTARGLGQDYRAASARWSWDDLRAGHEGLDGELLPLIEAGLIRTSLDPRANAVLVELAAGLQGSQSAQVRRAAAAAKVDVELKQGSAQSFEEEAVSCSSEARSCGYPLRGGVAISIGCTAGFKAVGNTYGNRFMLTAGHCADDWPTVYAWDSTESEPYGGYKEKKIGPTAAVDFPGHDWAAINANGSEWDGSPWPSEVALWGVDNQRLINYEGYSYLGEYVCHTGTATGTSCGYVSQLDKTAHYNDGTIVDHVVQVEPICIYFGDSGGPVLTGNTALGIVSGGNPKEAPECQRFANYVEITEAADTLGVTVGTRIGGAPSAATGSATSVGPYQATLGASINPNSVETTYYFQYGTTTGYGSTTSESSAGHGTSAVGVNKTITGLDPVTTYYFRAVAESAAGTSYGSGAQFTTPPAPPKATTEGTTSIRVEDETGKATVHGEVNPGGASTDYRFEWGTVASGEFENGAPVPDGDAGKGITYKSVQADLEGLKGLTEYHYRLRAENEVGASTGSVKTFTTPDWRPKAAQDGPKEFSVVKEDGRVTVHGRVTPGGFATKYHFEWGTEESGEFANSTSEVSAGNGFSEVQVSATIPGLASETTYAYKLVAESVQGEGSSEVWHFTTPNWRPRIVIRAGADASRTGASLEAFVNPQGFHTEYHFEWGATTAYGNSVPIPDGDLGSGTAPVQVEQSLEGLAPHQVYHFRIVAEDKWGETKGPGHSFTTTTSGFEADELGSAETMTVSASQEGSTLLGGTECGIFTFSGEGESSGKSVERVETVPTIEDCTEHKGLYYVENWSVTTNECGFTFHPGAETSSGTFEGTYDLGPPSCGPLTFTGQSCTKKFYPQRGVPVTYRNEGEGASATVKIESESALAFVSEGAEFFCGPEVSSNTLLGTWSMKATNEGGALAGLQAISGVPAAPGAITRSAARVEPDGAVLRAWVYPNYDSTSYQFEYGTTTEYGSTIPTTAKEAGSGEGPAGASEVLDGLDPNTTYHYRVVATNSQGTSYGKDVSFTTQRWHTPAFAAEEYPMVIGGEQQAEDPLVLTIHGNKVECEQVYFEGELTAAGPQAPLASDSEGCSVTIFGIKKYATVELNSCHYQVNLLNVGPPYTGALEIACESEGDAIEAKIYNSSSEAKEPLCEYEIAAQSGLEGLGFGEGSEGAIGFGFEVEGISYTSTIKGGICGSAETGNATYMGSADIWETYISGQGTQGLYLAGEESEEEASALPRIEAERYPAAILGAQSDEAPLAWTLGSLTVSCEHVYFEGEEAAPSEELALASESQGCSAKPLGIKKFATIEMNSCHYDIDVLNAGPPYAGSVDIACEEEGDAIEAKIYNNSSEAKDTLCEFELSPQNGLEVLGVQNSGEGSEREVSLTFELNGVSFTRLIEGGICGSGSSGTGKYSGGASLGAF